MHRYLPQIPTGNIGHIRHATSGSHHIATSLVAPISSTYVSLRNLQAAVHDAEVPHKGIRARGRRIHTCACCNSEAERFRIHCNVMRTRRCMPNMPNITSRDLWEIAIGRKHSSHCLRRCEDLKGSRLWRGMHKFIWDVTKKLLSQTSKPRDDAFWVRLGNNVYDRDNNK